MGGKEPGWQLSTCPRQNGQGSPWGDFTYPNNKMHHPTERVEGPRLPNNLENTSSTWWEYELSD